jgi:hypothetical protein
MFLFLVFLPVLFVFWLVFAILKFAFRLTFALLALPFIFIGLVAAALMAGFALFFAVLLPLAPILLLIGLGWAIMRSSRAASAIPN